MSDNRTEDVKFRYLCIRCHSWHWNWSKIGKEHWPAGTEDDIGEVQAWVRTR